MTNETSSNAVVVCSSRRFVSLMIASGELIQATTSAKTLDVCVGDKVSYEQREGDNFITAIETRKNELIRSYRKDQKMMASNLDKIYIVTAVGQAFNALFIDRVLAVASSQDIPCALLVNKVDQGLGETEHAIQLYKELGFEVLCLSAKFDMGLEDLSKELEQPEIQAVALVGVSGVGKSTLLNRYVPGAKTRTQEVNERTGLGRQTTTQALAHSFFKKSGERMFFVDMPGLQSFGVAHLSKQDIANSFPEILHRSAQCEFSNCGHIREQVCAVRSAAENGEIAVSRYISYVKMIEEIEESKEY